ncbi:hypothetical protein, partial [Pseudonocardia sp.]|uniref:hypothetical protein n=1 Tax=Pseudonocardia sp. TaxID=60912 RepID=UPI003D0DEF4D
MFDSEATAEELDTILAQVSVQSVFYRSLLVLLIDREAQTYDLAGARTRALELVKDTYSQMRAQATAAGFSEHFSITLAEMAIRASLSRDGGRDDVYLYMVKSVAKRGLHSITDAELAATNGHDVTDVVQGR